MNEVKFKHFSLVKISTQFVSALPYGRNVQKNDEKMALKIQLLTTVELFNPMEDESVENMNINIHELIQFHVKL